MAIRGRAMKHSPDWISVGANREGEVKITIGCIQDKAMSISTFMKSDTTRTGWKGRVINSFGIGEWTGNCLRNCTEYRLFKDIHVLKTGKIAINLLAKSLGCNRTLTATTSREAVPFRNSKTIKAVFRTSAKLDVRGFQHQIGVIIMPKQLAKFMIDQIQGARPKPKLLLRTGMHAIKAVCWIPALLVMTILGTLSGAALAKAKDTPPNILFVIMDDVGMDQMELFGYGGEDPDKDGRAANLPNIAAIADEGIGFRNTWSMPACSTSRAVFFTGRFPLRTNVLGALGPDDLANAQVSPFEVTLPTLLKQSGYASALFGKFHIGLQGNNPFTYAMPSALGWDYFYGWLDVTGDPSSIDKTAGNVSQITGDSYSCGFVPGADVPGGADFGACYSAKGKCEFLTSTGGVPPGRACRDGGGILIPKESCQKKMPDIISDGFDNLSAHYVSPLVINDKHGKVDRVDPSDIRARTFRGSAPVDAAIDWIKHQPKSKPWMASVSFASAHTPAMQPPQVLLNDNVDPESASSLSCETTSATGDQDEQDVLDASQRELTTQLIEAMDVELGRLLVSIGVASYNPNGSLNYDPENEDTMVVILGDNGTLGNIVKLPFDPKRAKGTAYQTGVWVPLIVAGPLVKGTGRQVKHMVNIADLYQLFGEIAGIDVEASVPRKLDAKKMLAYLIDPNKGSIRSLNFTQVAPNDQVGNAINGPCVIDGGCTQIPVTPGVCTDNGGIWYGNETTIPDLAPDGLQYCCQVNQYLWTKADGISPDDPNAPTYVNLQPLSSVAMRNSDGFKVVRNNYMGEPDPGNYIPDEMPSCADPNLPDEFYFVDEGTQENPAPVIDYEDADLINQDTGLPKDETLTPIFLKLQEDLYALLHSHLPCPLHGMVAGYVDGNLDGVVDSLDIDDYDFFASLSNKLSSWYDVDLDGKTNKTDLRIIETYQGINCQE